MNKERIPRIIKLPVQEYCSPPPNESDESRKNKPSQSPGSDLSEVEQRLEKSRRQLENAERYCQNYKRHNLIQTNGTPA